MRFDGSSTETPRELDSLGREKIEREGNFPTREAAASRVGSGFTNGHGVSREANGLCDQKGEGG